MNDLLRPVQVKGQIQQFLLLTEYIHIAMVGGGLLAISSAFGVCSLTFDVFCDVMHICIVLFRSKICKQRCISCCL